MGQEFGRSLVGDSGLGSHDAVWQQGLQSFEGLTEAGEPSHMAVSRRPQFLTMFVCSFLAALARCMCKFPGLGIEPKP